MKRFSSVAGIFEELSPIDNTSKHLMRKADTSRLCTLDKSSQKMNLKNRDFIPVTSLQTIQRQLLV